MEASEKRAHYRRIVKMQCIITHNKVLFFLPVSIRQLNDLQGDEHFYLQEY